MEWNKIVKGIKMENMRKNKGRMVSMRKNIGKLMRRSRTMLTISKKTNT
jgi:hypothetical protein